VAKNPSLERIFTYHPPFGTQAARYVTIRDAALAFATVVRDNTPPSREQSLAFTDIQRACQMANAAIAINEQPSQFVEIEATSAPVVGLVTESVQSTDAAASTNQESV
jgi:hypothetical protein